jgi:predicted MFS family arabinose efflux permease
MTTPLPAGAEPLTRRQKIVVALLAFLQFTLVLDFMILSPLGAILLDELHIDTAQFGLVVSAYAFAAGLSGVLLAPYADRFDRKTLLVAAYVGFLTGTLLCGIAPSYNLLLAARVITGLFAGVLGGVVMAIVADVFPYAQRGRAMGAIQTSFGAAQVLGIPVGLALANAFGWHAPFLLIVAVGLVVGVVIVVVLQPLRGHLGAVREAPLAHLFHTATKSDHLRAFAATGLLVLGGFMIGPFSTTFLVNNLSIPLTELPVLYMVTGAVALFVGPAVGRLADNFGKFQVFAGGSVVAAVVIVIYTHLSGPTSVWFVVVISIVMFSSIMSRMVPAGALTSAVPAPQDRGAFMSINSSLQQVSGGIAAALGGIIVFVGDDGLVHRFDLLGWVVAGASIFTIYPMWVIDRRIRARTTPL